MVKSCIYGRIALLLLSLLAVTVDSFQLIPASRLLPSKIKVASSSARSRRVGSSFCLKASSEIISNDILTNVELPLLDLTGTEYADAMTQPLPSSHLPAELATLSIYTVELKAPLHRMVVQQAVESSNTDTQMFGHVVLSQSENLVGAVGCAARVHPASLPALKKASEQQEEDADAKNPPVKILCQGTFRFVVKEVLQEIPYPVVLVDELVDDDDVTSSTGEIIKEEEDDDDDDDYDTSSMYQTMSNEQLIEKMFGIMEEYSLKQLEDTELDNLSPLEQSILVDTNLAIAPQAQRNAAEEANAVLQVFQSTVYDFCLNPRELLFAIAMMGAEMCIKDNVARRRVLQFVHGRERLIYVLSQLDDVMGMERARKLATQITDTTDEASKDLKVGEPQLPPWTKSIQKGTKLEYYWNDEYEWCAGEVVEEPMLVVDEIILTVYFDDDQTTHRLPFRADEKARWRPV